MSPAFALEPIEKASIDELRALQLKRLQATLHHAYANSPVYRLKFEQAGVHPDDCRSLADLARFPMPNMLLIGFRQSSTQTKGLVWMGFQQT